MTHGLTVAMLASLAAVDLQQTPIGAPETMRRIEITSGRGTPTQMCPSPDGTEVYLRISTFDRWANESVRHELVSIRGTGRRVVDDEPAWAARYWSWKSAPEAPGHSALRLVLERREEIVRGASVASEGGIGQNTSDPYISQEELTRNAALSRQKAVVLTLSLHGRVVARTVNESLKPGRTFGWAPASLGWLAYVNEKGGLVLMDERGRSREVRGTRNVLLPAWTDEGRTLLFLQRSGSGVYDLRSVSVG